MDTSLTVKVYSCFIDRVEANRVRGMGRDDAIIEAMLWCIDNNIMREFLEAHKWEVFTMVNLWWNEDDARKSYIAQGIEQGERKTLLGNIRNLMDSLHLTAGAAMQLLKISPEKQKELAPLI